MTRSDLSATLVSRLEADGVDIDRMIRFLDDLNAGKYDQAVEGQYASVPDLTHPSILDRRGQTSITLDPSFAASRFAELGLPGSPSDWAHAGPEGHLTFGEDALRDLGVSLYPRAAYGVLNGGSASSYADVKKNRALDPDSFDRYREVFDSLATGCRGVPKGITAAYINADGSPGYSFLLLKLRMVLRHRREWQKKTGQSVEGVLPLFQMTSVHTDAAVAEALDAYRTSECIVPLVRESGGIEPEIVSACQTMMAAITHSSEGSPRRIFDRAWGDSDRGIAMPGGHGQNFEVLAGVYRSFLERGIRYVWLGNIDNMGYTVDPVGLAAFALSGKEAVFEQSFRTAMDVKGGILVSGSDGRLTCADIGPAVSFQDVLDFEAKGKHILFNCGIGLFDLAALVPRLDSIPWKLPLRVTDQDKDAGRYAQAEQITWEVIGLLDNPLFFAVRKETRFLAAKMLMETILTSLPPDTPQKDVPITGGSDTPTIATVAAELHQGLCSLLGSEYGLVERNSRWLPA